MAADERWYFTKDQLSNTPSRRCGYDVDKELSYRQQAANFIQDMGQRLLVTQLCINTAIVYMHRFYVFHSFTQFHRNAMAAASLFLAAKVEEQPRKLEHVIKVAYVCLHRDQPPLDTKSEAYLEQAQDLVFNENVLLQTLGFDVAIDHPHTHVVRCCHLVRASKDLAQTSYFMASNSLHLTTMCLQYKPTVVACFCIHLACKWSNWEIPQSNEGKDWFWYVDKTVSLDQLEQLTAEFLVIFDKCPTKLKHKIKSISATQNTSVPPSVSGSPFDSEPRRVRPPGSDSSTAGSSGSQDAQTSSSLFRSSTSSSSVPQDSTGVGSSWMTQHVPSSSLPSIPREQVVSGTSQQALPQLPTYREHRKERERLERDKISQTSSAGPTSSRIKGDIRRPTVKPDGHHHHHHHHHGVPPAPATSSHHKPSSSVSHVKPSSVSQSAGTIQQQASMRPPPLPPGVTAARDAARREAAHARDANRRRADPYGSYRPSLDMDAQFESSLNHWSHSTEETPTDSRHRDKDRHSLQRLPPPPPPPLPPPPPPPPPPQPPARTKENPPQVLGGLPDLGSVGKQDLPEPSKHGKSDSYASKIESSDSKSHLKIDSSNNSAYHTTNAKQDHVDSKHIKVEGYNSTTSSSSRHRSRPSDPFTESSGRYDGRPRTATPPKSDTSNGKTSHMTVLPPSSSLPQSSHSQSQSSRALQQQSQTKKPVSPHHHHHHRSRSPNPPQSVTTSTKTSSAVSGITSKSNYYSTSKSSSSQEPPSRNGTTSQHDDVTALGVGRRSTLRPPSTPPRPDFEPLASSPTSKPSERKSTSGSIRESPYGQRSKRQRTPPSASKKSAVVDSSSQPSQLSLADLGTPPPPPPPVAISPFGSPPATSSGGLTTGAPATPGKSVTTSSRSRLRTSSSSSEPEPVLLLTKLENMGFENIGSSMSVRLPEARVPELIPPLKDIAVAASSGCAPSTNSRNSLLNAEPGSDTGRSISSQLTSQQSHPSSVTSSQQLPSQQSSSDLGAVAFPSPATHAAVDPDDGIFSSSVPTALDVMSEQLPSLDRILDPGGPISTSDVTAAAVAKRPGEHHHKSDKKKKKEKHRRKEKDKDKDRDKDKERSPHKLHKLKHKKEKHKDKADSVSVSTSLSSTSAPSSMNPPPSAPIKITIPKDKINLSSTLDPPHGVVLGSSSVVSTGLKLKIQKDRLKVPEVSTASSTSSTTPGGGIKIKISKDVIANATPSVVGSSTSKDSRKRDRTSPRGDQPPSKQSRVDSASSSSRRSSSTSSSSYNKQNGVPSSSGSTASSSTSQSQQLSQRGNSYPINKATGRTEHPHHYPSHPARSRSGLNVTPASQPSQHHSHHHHQ